ncbi:type VI secretion system contractile sheath large subunit [Ruegeria sp. HKCCA6837]|uniref:type VI secretion system contractile sheath large subunit n=1 Tax=Ruegeria sp. HKCCA6837 TaxID=2682989 RepID=UPI0014876762|nr:type VI secretion system contractile sheath large subunit [Ruegeria sp. HKCCA6837]
MEQGRRILPPVVGRADLVRAGLDLRGADRKRAEWYGYDYRDADPLADLSRPTDGEPRPAHDGPGKSLDSDNDTDPLADRVFCSRITTREISETRNVAPPTELRNVVWSTPPEQPAEPIPLMSELRVQQTVEALLHTHRVLGRPDLGRLVDRIARAQPLDALPRKETVLRASAVQIIVDRSTRLTPIWEDQSRIVKQIAQTFPDLTLRLWLFDEALGALRPLSRAAPPRPGAELGPLLGIGDLGLLGGRGDVTFWRDLARTITFEGGHACALIPEDGDRIDRTLTGPWQLVSMEPRLDHVAVATVPDGARGFDIDSLLAVASCTVRLEPGLLRTLRRTLFPEASVADELRFWQHPALQSRSADAASFTVDARSVLSLALARLAKSDPHCVQMGLASIRSWRQGGADEIWFEELLGLPEAIRTDPRFVDPADLQEAKDFFANMHGAVAQEVVSAEQEAWLSRVGDRHRKINDGIWKDPHAAAAMDAVLRKDPNFRPPVIIERQPHAEDWQAVVAQDPKGQLNISSAMPSGTQLGHLTLRSGEVELLHPQTQTRLEVVTLDKIGEFIRIEPPKGPFILQSSRARMVIEPWAEHRPIWADRIDRDRFGIRAGLDAQGATLWFRWIPPGLGFVGPSDDEPLELTSGTREVIKFATGFWLMDKPLTSSKLYSAFELPLGSNSASESASAPVSKAPLTDPLQRLSDRSDRAAARISLADVKDLIDRIRPHAGDLRLPTPLEWEYACRAGVHHARTYAGDPSLGDAFDKTLSEIAWYRPTQAELDAPGRQLARVDAPQSVARKRANDWGLHDMLGNVAEWCQPDPDIPHKAPVKGGSYSHEPVDIRAAFVDHLPIEERFDWVGARLAIGAAEIESRHRIRRQPRRVPPKGTKFISRNRSPRVSISYPDPYDSDKQVELPFVVGVLANLMRGEDAALLEERQMREIDRDNFGQWMQQVCPQITVQFRLPPELAPESAEDAEIRHTLWFRTLDDFKPDSFILQIAPLLVAFDLRNILQNMLLHLRPGSALTDHIESVVYSGSYVEPARVLLAERDRIHDDALEDKRSTAIGEDPFELLPRFDGGDLKNVNAALATVITSYADDPQPYSHGDGIIARIQTMIADLDQTLSGPVTEILHHPEFRRVERTWRGLHYLVDNVETGANLKIRVLDITKAELMHDMANLDGEGGRHSVLARHLDEQVYGLLGGEPFGVIIGDFTFDHSEQDVSTLRTLSKICETALTPFIASASRRLFGIESWRDLEWQGDIRTMFSGPEYAAWHFLRQTPRAAYLALTMPDALARQPYGADTNPIATIVYDEPVDHAETDLPWMSAAYLLASRIAVSFKQNGWPVQFQGATSGGLISNLPTMDFSSADRFKRSGLPISVTDRQEVALSREGIIAFISRKNTDMVATLSAQSLYQVPLGSADTAETVRSRLSFLMPALRFAQYLKCMARDQIGSGLSPEDVEKMSQEWLDLYVLADPLNSAEAVRAIRPLGFARISVTGGEVDYVARLDITPAYQTEGLDQPIRLKFQLAGRR